MTEGRDSPSRSGRRRGSRRLSLTMASALAACTPAADTPAPPPNAIQVGSDLYMVPMGEDETGCPMFQPWSATLAVVQALHWRTADGGFTLDRAAADCPPLPD